VGALPVVLLAMAGVEHRSSAEIDERYE